MTNIELNNNIEHILHKAQEDIHNLRMKYITENAIYKKGQFIRNITGIIKITDIKYDIFFNNTEIVYCGHKYKMTKGILTRTQHKDKVCLSHNVMPIENPIEG